MEKDGRKLIGWIFGVFKKRALTFFAGFVFALLCFVVLNAAMELVSKPESCGTGCHEMDTAYQSWKLSVHGANMRGLRVECIDCHLVSKDKYFTHVVTKAYLGTTSLYKHYFGGEYDVEEIREKVLNHISNAECLSCHTHLLAKPSSDEVEEAHTESLSSPDMSEYRCVECHEEVGHQRY
jgi:nitrate/TMAO reductase-like tetraheme cytochrome c subunit